MWMVFLIVLILILVFLINLSVLISKQLKVSKDIESAIYRLMEIVKQQGSDR